MPGKYKGGGGGNLTAAYIIQTADATLTGAQVLGSLGTGVVLNATTTGVLSIATLVGLTLAAGTLKNDFSTGKALGLTVIGDTASGGNLTFQSTAHATRGKLKFGSAGTSVYDEVNDRWGLGGNTAPGCAVGIGDEVATSGLTVSRQLAIGTTGETFATIRLAQSTTIGVNVYYTSSGTAGSRRFDIDSASYAIPVYIGAKNLYLQHNPASGTKAVVIGQSSLDTDGTARLIVNCTYDGVTSSANVKWNGVSVVASTLTLYTAVNVTNATGLNLVNVEAGTLTSASAITVTNAATLRLAGPMVGAGSVTITNAYTLWSDSGLNRFDGNGTHVFELPADATDPTGGGGAAAGRIPVLIGGALKYLAYY